jgi:hypothetical protein
MEHVLQNLAQRPWTRALIVTLAVMEPFVIVMLDIIGTDLDAVIT